MELDRLAVRLRPRENWEAIDLGFAMVRRWWRPVWTAWLMVALPATIAVNLLAWSGLLWGGLLGGMLLMWWLKPLYDRAVLHVLARAVFGAVPTARAIRAELGAVLPRALAGDLTIRRLQSSRALYLPVRLLEGQEGKAARERERLLARRAGAQMSTTSFTLFFIEMACVMMSLLLLVDFLTPAKLAPAGIWKDLIEWLFDANRSTGEELARNALFFAAMAIVEPFHIGAGFALYLNRRSSLEGWDLELRLRSLAARKREANADRAGKIRAATLLLAAALCAATAIESNPAHAQTPAPVGDAAERPAKHAIEKILQADEFQEKRKETVWRLRRDGADAKKADENSAWIRFQKWLVNAMVSLAEAMRIAVWMLIAAAVLAIGWYLARRFELWQDAGGRRRPPAVLFGLDIRPESLPDDIAATARALAATDPLAALSLLYRGALSALVHRDGLVIAAGDTEGDCERRVARAIGGECAGYFARLVAMWSRGAYAHSRPQSDEVLALCGEWPAHFAAPRASA